MTPQLNGSSPWGQIDHLEEFRRDGKLVAVSVSTPSHGGFWVVPHEMPRIPECLRTTNYSRGGWFEEDCDWAIPYVFLQLGAIDTYRDQTEAARETLQRYHGEVA